MESARLNGALINMPFGPLAEDFDGIGRTPLNQLTKVDPKRGAQGASMYTFVTFALALLMLQSMATVVDVQRRVQRCTLRDW